MIFACCKTELMIRAVMMDDTSNTDVVLVRICYSGQRQVLSSLGIMSTISERLCEASVERLGLLRLSGFEGSFGNRKGGDRGSLVAD